MLQAPGLSPHDTIKDESTPLQDTMLFKIFTFFLTLGLCTAISIDRVEAKTRQVGPTSFHKQIHIPKTSNRGDGYNNDESYRSSANHKKRQDRRRQRGTDKSASGEETRTQTDNANTKTRQGRRERQSNARELRMQARAVEKFASDRVTSAVND